MAGILKQAAVLYQIPETWCKGVNFKPSAEVARTFLKHRGFDVAVEHFKSHPTLASTPRIAAKLDCMVWYCHGDFDGPILFWDEGPLFDPNGIPGQISPNEPSEWVQLMTYFKQQMQPGGMFVAHCCHAAGGDRVELKWKRRAGIVENRVWIRDVAKHMNVYTFGAAGRSGAAHLPTVKALLEFVFTGRNLGYPQFQAYAPGGTRLVGPANWPQTRAA